jgi:hypothetical protein
MELKKSKKIYKRVKQFISLAALVLSMFFAWLQFDNVSFKPLMNDVISEIFFKLAISIYYFSWVFGTIGDMKSEKQTFKLHPQLSSLSLGAGSIMLMIVVLFTLLCFFNTYKLFIVALTVFLIFNFVSWKYFLKYFINPAISESRKLVKSPIEMEYVNTFNEYISGKWQLYRFGYAGIFIILFNVTVFTELINKLSTHFGVSSQFIFSSSLLFYIITFEAWIWVRRIIRIYTFRALENINKEFFKNQDIEPRQV